MTVNNAYRSRTSAPRIAPSSCRAGAFGLALGLLAAFGGVHAAPASAVAVGLAQSVPVSPLDPGKRLPGAIEVADIDFNRGEGGAGRLTLRFDQPGAMADLQNEPSRVVIQVPNASVPASLERPLDVSDFATPVQDIHARDGAGGTTIVLDTRGNYETMAYQSDNQYIVEVMPRAEPQAAVAAEAQLGNGVALPGERTYSGRPVTFNFQDVPVRTVLQLIAEESNLNIVVSDSVSGNVTLRLINVPWDQALDIVLRAKGLDKRRNGNVVWVAPQAEIATYEQNIQNARLAIENSAELQTEFIPINYANAEEIARLLTESSRGGAGGGAAGAAAGNAGGFLSPRGSISADARTNTLLVIDIPERLGEIRNLVMQLDKPVDQVLIEARIVIATESFARELGAKFGISGSDGSYNDQSSLGVGATTDQSSTNAQARADAIAGGDPSGRHTISNGLNVNLPSTLSGAGSLALSILNAGYMLDIELSALQQQGRGEVISNPRIVTSNQKEAIIKQGQEVGYVTISPTQGAGTIPIPNVQFKDVLLELMVTPTITHDGRVFMELAVKKDEVEGFVDTSIGDVPTISTREVTTAVLVEDGQTVVIGGVYEFRDREDVSKVPFLGDLPFIGNLFRNKGRSHEKAELLIFVTPKVMRVAQRGSAALQRPAAVATIRRELFPGEVLFRHGDPAGCAWLVERGEVILQVESVAGPQPPRVFGAGELIGELALLDGAPYRATAIARDDAVLLAIDADQFDERIETADPIVRAVVDSLRGRMRALQEALPANTPLPLEDQPCDDPEERAGIAKIHFETQLREALDRGTLEVHYQPIYDLQAGRVGGYEALVRWSHEDRGQVSPADFIRLAEETSLIVPLGEYVLDRAIDVLRGLHQAHGDALPSIAVNLSARQLVQPGMARQVVSRIAQARLPKGALKLEVTESRMLDYAPVAAVMRHCRAEGVPFALDDFGTGYSNLTHLHELEFEYLKVDQAFCRNMLGAPRAMAIVEAIVAMGHGIGAQVIMEGVETREQLAELRRMQVRHAQGWLVGKAQPADAVLSGRAAAVSL